MAQRRRRLPGWRALRNQVRNRLTHGWMNDGLQGRQFVRFAKNQPPQSLTVNQAICQDRSSEPFDNLILAINDGLVPQEISLDMKSTS